jgi:hypothetical protein
MVVELAVCAPTTGMSKFKPVMCTLTDVVVAVIVMKAPNPNC